MEEVWILFLISVVFYLPFPTIPRCLSMASICARTSPSAARAVPRLYGAAPGFRTVGLKGRAHLY